MNGSISDHRFRKRLLFWAGMALVWWAGTAPLQAARISDLVEVDFVTQFKRFFSLQDRAVRQILLGTLFMGINFGLLGSFVVVRKMALVGDTLSHAVLPGVAVGFLFTLSKNPLAILLGATAAGLLGTTLVSVIQHTTKLKQDAALGMVLASFFALGICLIKMVERVPAVNKSGLDHFFYGQAAALGTDDLWMMGLTSLVTIVAVWKLYRPLLASSFDPVFSESIDYPVRGLYHVLMFLLAMSTVVALQAVGALMVSAMLITPAATAYLLTKRMHRLLVLATVLAISAGLLGAFISFVGEGALRRALPTGPSMALCAGLFFGIAFLFSPSHGVVFRFFSRRSQSKQIVMENMLKAIYHAREADAFRNEGVDLVQLSAKARESLDRTQERVRMLRRDGLATLADDGNVVYLTPRGFQEASRIVRNHRLWELYLTNSADFEADHVHDDAEKVEHILGERTVMRLEKALDYPEEDPHGKRIPSLRDTQSFELPPSASRPSKAP